MMIKEYDIVALIEDVSTKHLETQEPVLLRRGQVGTVVMTFDGNAFLVDFADNDGQSYAMETIPEQKLLLLRNELDAAVA